MPLPPASTVEVTRPAAPLDLPVSVAELRQNTLAPEGAAEDGLLRTLLLAATKYVEEAARTLLAPCAVVETFCRFPCGSAPLGLTREPCTRVSMLDYADADGALRQLSNGEFQAWAAHAPPLVFPAPLAVWPATQAGNATPVRVYYDGGPASAAAADPALKLAVLTIASASYEYRDAWTRGGELTIPAFARGMIAAGSRRGY